MRIKLSAETTWIVSQKDKEMARRLLKEQPTEEILSFLMEANSYVHHYAFVGTSIKAEKAQE